MIIQSKFKSQCLEVKGKKLTCGDWRVDTKDTAGSAVVTVRSEHHNEQVTAQLVTPV